MVDGTIVDIARETAPYAAGLRHHFHANPELSDAEAETSARVAAELTGLGITDVAQGIGGYGIIAEIPGQSRTPVVALRADMDALPVDETGTPPWKSLTPGVMHACGHDGHMATLLGSAAVLSRLRDELAGTVRLIFQPAEETVGGAVRMCEAGAMDGVGMVFALHGWPQLAVGRIGVRRGAMMASSDTFEIVVVGNGCHAAMPHLGVDPILVASHVVTALQSLSSRELAPTEPVVVSVTRFHAGTGHNVIGNSATLTGTYRCLDEPTRQGLPGRIERIVAGVCAAMRADYRITFRTGTGVTVNSDDAVDIVVGAGVRTLGPTGVEYLAVPSMGAEDFSVYLHHAPGAFFRVGVGTDSPSLHNSAYDFADGALEPGIAVLASCAHEALLSMGSR